MLVSVRILKLSRCGADMVVRLQLMGMDMTREALVKIERGIQHIYASQLKAIKEVLGTTYDELLGEDSGEEK